MKATHTGTCQACGRAQRLPGGVLAKHGYTTRWGFFSSTCPGSGRLPFEVSTDYIADCIAMAQRQAASLRAEAGETLAAPVNPNDCWYHEFVPADWTVRHSSYRWVKVALEGEHLGGGITVRFLTPASRPRKSETIRYNQSGAGYTKASIAEHGNRSRAHSLDRDADQRDSYIAWQEGRLAAWTPGTLKAVG